MIRPITVVTFLLAGASGIYVYQSKHEVQLLDHKIEQTVHDTNTIRAQSRLLATEWEMLNNTDSLRQFSDTYLRSLKSITPSQFTSLAELNTRLPAPQPEMHGEEDQQLVPPNADHPALLETSDAVIPVPPIPIISITPRPVEAKAPERVAPSRPAAAESPSRSTADTRAPEPHAARVAEARPEAKVPAATAPKPIVLAAPRTAPVTTTVTTPLPPMASSPALIAAAGPYGGSLLGMARGMVPAAPRPLPVSTTYNAN